MKLLVTGGCGFIGSNFIRYWLAKYPDDLITVLDKLTYAGHEANLQGLKYRFVKGDICDPEIVASAMLGQDVVVHFAAESHVDRSISGPEDFIRTNIVGTQVLLSAALKAQVKLFHHVSTDEVFGSLPLNQPQLKFSESSPYAPHSPYSASKAAADHLVRAWHTTYGLPVTITNCSNNFGPYQDPEKFLPLLITHLIDGKKVPLYGDGLNVRDWLHVTDHCRAIELVITQGKVGETYCIGGSLADLNNLEVTRKVLRLFALDDSFIDYVPDRPGHDRRYAVDWSKIHQELGWQPEHDFETWLKHTVTWYKANPGWWKPLVHN